MVVKDTVNPTDCAFTSQKHTNRPQVLLRGRYAIQAAETVHSMLAAVAVKRRAVSVVSKTGVYVRGSERLTIWDVEYNGTTNEQRSNLYSVTHRFELGRHGSSEAHIADNNGGKRVDDAIGDGTAILDQHASH
jgi:hypothetical protein